MDSTSKRLTGAQWLICFIAAVGFAFDTYELLMMPLIMRPALMELGNLKPDTPEFNNWVALLFWTPALVGGFFGLIGGYLTDLFGRRRVLVWSILLYAFSAFAAGFSTSLTQLLVLRCTTFMGVCVEFVAAVAWLAELFSNPRQREMVLGYTQAFSSVGGLLVTAAFLLAGRYAGSLPAIHGGHEPWRYTIISGVIPALPLILIRPFLPESPDWAAKKAAGKLRRPSFAELFQPKYARTTIVSTLLMACAYGAAFGAIQHIPRIVPGLPEVQALVKEQPTPQKGKEVQAELVSSVQFFQEVGGLTGRFVLAFLAIYIASRGNLLRLFQIPGLIIIPLVFLYPATNNLTLLKYGMFAAGFLTVAQFSFWGNYLPRVYPTHLRGTGESFAANVGGRMLGTSAAFVTTQLANHMTGPIPPTRMAYAAAAVAATVYAIGVAGSFFLPEPPAETEKE